MGKLEFKLDVKHIERLALKNEKTKSHHHQTINK